MQQRSMTISEIFNAHMFKGLKFTDRKIEEYTLEELEEFVTYCSEFPEFRIDGSMSDKMIDCPVAHTVCSIFLGQEKIKIEDLDQGTLDRILKIRINTIRGVPTNPFLSPQK